jgi:predicted  nucleic acid-binding Zn-ribbon protein
MSDALWISQLRKELLGDILGKIQQHDNQIDKLEIRTGAHLADLRAIRMRLSDIEKEQAAQNDENERCQISAASDMENLKKRIEKIEGEMLP